MNIQKLLKVLLVPLAFIACSEDNGLVSNAPSGEPEALSSSSDNIPASSSSEQNDGAEKVYRDITIYTLPFGYVHIYELDPVTFDTTKSVPYTWILRTGLSDVDSVFVDSLPLKSPYVMFLTDLITPYYNIVDIREASAFAVDKKTSLESTRVLYLIKSGMSFAEAKKQASKEILETFGSYVDAFDKPEAENVKNADYRNYMAFIEDFMNYTTEDTVVAKFEKCGNITCDTEFLKTRFLSESMDMLMQCNETLTMLMRVDELKQYEALEASKARRNLLFLELFVARLLGVGECSAEKEGKSFEILNKNIMLTCRSENWDFSYKEMKYSMGTMTDERDGKAYKTVIYDINGKKQTWLAERLDYNASELQVSCEGRETGCGMYYVDGAFSLDSSVLESKEACVQRFLENCPECDASNFAYECEESRGRLDSLKYRQHIDSVMAEKGVYQGACPDGWHIPTRGEVNSLLDYMVEWYNPQLPKNAIVDDRKGMVLKFLARSFLGNPSGFGLTREEYDFYVVDGGRACSAMDESYCFYGEYPFVDELFVRCIKN